MAVEAAGSGIQALSIVRGWDLGIASGWGLKRAGGRRRMAQVRFHMHLRGGRSHPGSQRLAGRVPGRGVGKDRRWVGRTMLNRAMIAVAG